MNRWMHRLMNAVAPLCVVCACVEIARAETAEVIVVVGAPGTHEYGKQFQEWSGRWAAAAKSGQANCTLLGVDESKEGDVADRERLQEALKTRSAESKEPLWLVLIGHGTFDGKTARFNLRGPDFTPADLKAWLRPIERPLVLIDCSSSSGPFLAELSGPGRIVITATRAGHEYNFARFGNYLSAALTDSAADLDKDEQTSLLEAYLVAASRLREYYANDTRLDSEHPLLDDNGDRQGTPADWFQGLRAVKSAKSGVALDGARAARLVLVPSSHEQQLSAEVRERRDALEQELAAWRKRKSEVDEEEYFGRLERLLVEMATLYAGDGE